MRNRRVDSSLHTASRRTIDLLVSEGIGTLVIGKNPLWKQDVQLGKRTNQQFVQIPHARFIDQLTYKARLVGIQVLLQEESYTCAASTTIVDSGLRPGRLRALPPGQHLTWTGNLKGKRAWWEKRASSKMCRVVWPASPVGKGRLNSVESKS